MQGISYVIPKRGYGLRTIVSEDCTEVTKGGLERELRGYKCMMLLKGPEFRSQHLLYGISPVAEDPAASSVSMGNCTHMHRLSQ